ncbi:MAG TPA: hypothetical protein VIF08_01565, partial [Candidatus Limnocylindrales bacterium]
MRNFWHSLRRSVEQRPRATLAAGLIAVALVAAGVTWIVSNPARTPPVDVPTATATERWTLLELATRIDAGQVTAVTVGAGESGGRVLLAQRADGAYVAITFNGSVGDAAAALQTLGYDDLLTPSAHAAIDASAASPSAGDPLRNAISVGLVVLLAGVAVSFIYSARDRLPVLGRRGSRFSAIMPATPRSAASGLPVPG